MRGFELLAAALPSVDVEEIDAREIADTADFVRQTQLFRAPPLVEQRVTACEGQPGEVEAVQDILVAVLEIAQRGEFADRCLEAQVERYLLASRLRRLRIDVDRIPYRRAELQRRADGR